MTKVVNNTKLKEEFIRDYLADNLSLIENNLTLLSKEYPLPNAIGTTGRIDILARDAFEHLVVIEVKRSNQAARQALHELSKYTALLRANFKLPPENIRCILVSTHWDELLVPYSNFVKQTHYPIVGYQIQVNEQGHILSLKEVIPVEHSPEAELCPRHLCYLYQEAENKSIATQSLINGLSRLGVFDYCIVELAYTGNDRQIIYPYALYVVIDKFDTIQKEMVIKHFDLSYDLEFLEKYPWILEEETLGFLGELVNPIDTVEIGYPEKFVKILNEWKVTEITRKGRLDVSKLLIPDSKLIKEIMGIEGSNAQLFISQASPRFPPSWTRMREKARYCLSGNDVWSITFDWVLNHVQTMYPDAAVSATIYNPNNVLMSLYMIADKKDLRYHPLMEIVVEPKNTSQILLIIGSIDWNCDKQIEQPINLIEKYFGEVFNFFIEYNLGIQDWKELMILHGLGLRYYTVKVEFENHEPQLSMLELNDDNVISVELSHPLGSLIDFIEENPQFIYQWSQMVKSSANGI